MKKLLLSIVAIAWPMLAFASTPTDTPTDTPTSTVTPSNTPTSVNTASPTSSASATFTATPTNVNCGSVTSVQAVYQFEQNGNDASGNGYNLATVGTVPYSTIHKQGNYSAGPFSNTNYYTVPTQASLGGVTQWSVSFWFYNTDNTDSQYPYYEFDNGTNQYIWIHIKNGFAYLNANGTSLGMAMPAVDNAWHLLTFTNAYDQVSMYMDATLTTIGTLPFTSNTMVGAYIGAFPGGTNGGSPVLSFLDDFRVYNCVLSQTEINTLAGGATPTPSPTFSRTRTNTPASTRTNTPTNTPTATPTATPSDTPTVTPSVTPSATPTSTASPTAGVTPFEQNGKYVSEFAPGAIWSEESLGAVASWVAFSISCTAQPCQFVVANPALTPGQDEYYSEELQGATTPTVSGVPLAPSTSSGVLYGVPGEYVWAEAQATAQVPSTLRVKQQ